MFDGDAIMKKTIFVLALLVGAAYYLHWFNFTTEGTGSNEHVNITFDKAKIAEDEAKAVRVLHDEAGRLEQDAAHEGYAVTPAPASSLAVPQDRPRASVGQEQSTGNGRVAPPSFDPYEPSGTTPATNSNGRSAPSRSAKRPPPSDFDRGFE
jgi:hypothetical protein